MPCPGKSCGAGVVTKKGSEPVARIRFLENSYVVQLLEHIIACTSRG